jgi:glycine hydroxymethyltransferase
MLAKLACLLEWHERDIRAYAQQIIDTARLLVEVLTRCEIQLVTGGTDCHILLLDLRRSLYSGAKLERRLEACGVLANRNLVPGDQRSPAETSGLRLGATNLAILGYEPIDTCRLAEWFGNALNDDSPPTALIDELIDKYQGALVTPMW